jgi:3-keto-5-aminohexanoate cleavage enzyme
VIIEARINEWSMRENNPNVPWTPAEIAADAEACWKAGASIVHFHPRNPDGSPSHDLQIYADSIRKIRQRCDILVHPTLGGTKFATDEDRIGPIIELSKKSETRSDFAPMDMGSTNVDMYDAIAHHFETDNKVYVNSIKTLSYIGQEIRRAGLKQLLCVWTVPCLRTIEAFIDSGLVDEPAFVCFVLTEGGIIGGHPGTIKGLESLLEFIPVGHMFEWSVCCREGNLFPGASAALERGGHVSIGLGDYHYRGLGVPTNADIIKEIVRMARLTGREPATPMETRAMLEMT